MQTYIEHIVDDSRFTKYYATSSNTGRKGIIGTEILDSSRDSLAGLTLQNKSLFFAIPVIYPEIFLRGNDDNLEKFIKMYLRGICEGMVSYEGISVESLDIQQATFKSPFYFINMVTQQQQPTTEITINLASEFHNYFFTKGTSLWMSQISDPYSKGAPYCGSGLEYNNYSHSASIAIIKPSEDWEDMHWGCYFYMMIPKTAPTDSWNADANSPGILNLQLSFAVNMLDSRNDKVRESLKELLELYRDFAVKDYTQQGIANNTAMDCLDEYGDTDRIHQDYMVDYR